jgi:hypothetical protein
VSQVGIAGQGNESNKAKSYLIGLSPNIAVIRHPNKIFGRTKAILWSHHEKLVIVDRCLSPLSLSLLDSLIEGRLPLLAAWTCL